MRRTFSVMADGGGFHDGGRAQTSASAAMDWIAAASFGVPQQAAARACCRPGSVWRTECLL